MRPSWLLFLSHHNSRVVVRVFFVMNFRRREPQGRLIMIDPDQRNGPKNH
jgi:hypothetical protein